MKRHTSGRGVLLVGLLLLVGVKGAAVHQARAAQEGVRVVTMSVTPSTSESDHHLFLPAIEAPAPKPMSSNCTSEAPELCH